MLTTTSKRWQWHGDTGGLTDNGTSAARTPPRHPPQQLQHHATLTAQHVPRNMGARLSLSLSLSHSLILSLSVGVRVCVQHTHSDQTANQTANTRVRLQHLPQRRRPCSPTSRYPGGARPCTPLMHRSPRPPGAGAGAAHGPAGGRTSGWKTPGRGLETRHVHDPTPPTGHSRISPLLSTSSATHPRPKAHVVCRSNTGMSARVRVLKRTHSQNA